MSTEDRDVMFVKKTTPSKQLGTAIIRKYEESEEVIYLRGIGAASITQCIYGILIAEDVLKKQGKKVTTKFMYTDVINTGSSRHQKPTITAVEFSVEIKNGENKDTSQISGL